MESLAVAINLAGMVADSRYSLTLEDDHRIVFRGTSGPYGEVETEGWNMDTNPDEEFNNWDNKFKTAYLIGYMDARTEMPYLYDFNAPDFQKCYEMGRVHGERDGILEEEED